MTTSQAAELQEKWKQEKHSYRCPHAGNVPLRVGQTCPLTVNLPNQPSLFVAVAIVRWVRGQEYGLETLVADKQMHSLLEQVIKQLEQDSFESIE
jgi:hypothetical protein